MFVTRAFADDNTVLSASLYQIVDWFDNFNLDGKRYGRDVRTTTNVNLGVTQLLTPTTIVLASYGFTVQGGTLTNTWNSVPLSDGTRGTEVVPRDASGTRSRGGSSNGSPGTGRSSSATASTPTAGAPSRTRWTPTSRSGWGG